MRFNREEREFYIGQLVLSSNCVPIAEIYLINSHFDGLILCLFLFIYGLEILLLQRLTMLPKLLKRGHLQEKQPLGGHLIS